MKDKDIITHLYYSAINNLWEMKVSEMSLRERVLYEKAIVQLDAMKRIIDKYGF